MNANHDDSIKEQIAIEKMLYGAPPRFEYIEIQKMDYLAKLCGSFPKLRPHYLDSFVIFCSPYLQNASLRKIVLEKVFVGCPALIQRLYQIGCFSENEIRESLEYHRREFLCLFFKNVIEVDNNYLWDDNYAYKNKWSDKELDSLILFGFLEHSIEFCLKYDLFNEIESLMVNYPNKRECKWSLFEWSQKPISLGFLSFSGFFGSLKCFRVLLLSGFVVDNQVARDVLFSGSRALFNLIWDLRIQNYSYLHEAARFVHLNIVEFLVNEKADINAKNNDVEI